MDYEKVFKNNGNVNKSQNIFPKIPNEDEIQAQLEEKMYLE